MTEIRTQTYEQKGYVFKIKDDKNRLRLVTPKRETAVAFISQRIGYRPKMPYDVLINGMYKICLFDNKQPEKLKPVIKLANYTVEPDCIGYYYDKPEELNKLKF